MTTTPAPAHRQAHILMIEDDPDFRRLVERWLATSADVEFGVNSATRLDEAWHRIATSDLILLDLGLPDAAGMDTLVAARELAPDLPIVVLTGLDDDDLGRRALLAGADAFVPKRRADSQTLQLALRRALASHAASHPERSAAPASEGSEESGVEDFWVDARYGSASPRTR